MLPYTVSPYGRLPAKSKRQSVRNTNKPNQTLRPSTQYSHKVMLKAEPPIKMSTMSPFNPLPAIGQIERSYNEDKYKRARSVLLYEVSDKPRPTTRSCGPLDNLNVRLTNNSRLNKVNEPLKPLKNRALTPLTTRLDANDRNSRNTDPIKDKPLHRENTYNVIDPIFLSGQRRDNAAATRRLLTPMVVSTNRIESNQTSEMIDAEESVHQARTKFKKVASDVLRLHGSETGKLLTLRRREDSFDSHPSVNEADEPDVLQSPTQKLNQISKIFQSLQMEGRSRDKVKKENNWF